MSWGQIPASTGNISEREETNELLTKLRFSGAVEFGSRALGVENPRSSDYDFAITAETYLSLRTTPGFNENRSVNMGLYFPIVPPTGLNYLVKAWIGNSQLDLLVLEHSSSLDTIRKAVKSISTHPKTKLIYKPYRIKVYQEALADNGWVLSTTRKPSETLYTYLKRRFKWTLRNFKKWFKQ
jgi:hypothetical protein